MCRWFAKSKPLFAGCFMGHCPDPRPAWLGVRLLLLLFCFLGRARASPLLPPTPHMWEPQLC
jgi:hypothetical protein